MDRPIEDGGFGGTRMCPCRGGLQDGVGLIGHAGPYTSLVVHVASERMTIAVVANVAIRDDLVQELVQDVHEIVWPALR